MSGTTADIVAEFVKGRPDLEAALRKKMVDVFCAPEEYAPKCADIVRDAMYEVTDEEKILLDKVRGSGKVDWNEVARAFGAPLDPKKDESEDDREMLHGHTPPRGMEAPKPATVDWVKARAVGAALAKDTEALSASLGEIEKRVVGLNIGVEASVEIEPGVQLLFGRHGDKWGFYVLTSSTIGLSAQVPLLGASRARRILAARHMVALLANLVDEGERMLHEVREAGDRVVEAIEIVNEMNNDG